MPETPAEKTPGSHSSKAPPNLSPFWCQICKAEFCLHNPPFHNTHQYSCLTKTPVWATLDHSLLHSKPFAAWDWGKVPRREHFSQHFLVELPTLTCLGWSWVPNTDPKRKCWVLPKLTETPSPGDCSMERVRSLQCCTKPARGSLKHLWVGTNNSTQHSPKRTVRDFYKILHFTKLLHRGFQQHRAACLGRVTNGISTTYSPSSCGIYILLSTSLPWLSPQLLHGFPLQCWQGSPREENILWS